MQTSSDNVNERMTSAELIICKAIVIYHNSADCHRNNNNN